MATAAAYGHALGIPVHGVCSLDAIGIESAATASEILVVTDARRREVYWARYRNGVRVEGPAVNAPADVPGAAEVLERPPAYPTAAGGGGVFGAPSRPGGGEGGQAGKAPGDVRGGGEVLEPPPAYPTAAGLVRVVPDWTAEPAPLVPLYLRRPDAKPQVVGR